MYLSKNEYSRRLKIVRRKMEENGIGVLLVYSWKRGQTLYLSGYQPGYVANMSQVIIPRQGECHLLIRLPFDVDRAKKESWIKNVEPTGSVSGFAMKCQKILKDELLSKGKIGIVAGDEIVDEMSHLLFLQIKESLPEAEFVFISHLLEEVRLIKSDEEIRTLKVSAAITDRAIGTVERVIPSSKRDYELVSAAEATARKEGADQFLVSLSLNADKQPVGPPQNMRIFPGQTIIVECAAQYRGYWTQAVRVFGRKASRQQKEIYQSTYRAYENGIKAAKPGNLSSDIAKKCLESIKYDGWGNWVEHDFGHGIGVDLPEKPSIKLERGLNVRPGMVLVIHPAIRKPGVGGAFLGGTLVVTKRGGLPLHNIPEEL